MRVHSPLRPALRLLLGAVPLLLATLAAEAMPPALGEPRLLDLVPGDRVEGDDVPDTFHRVGETTLFVARHGEEAELWRTDGTPGASRLAGRDCPVECLTAVRVHGGDAERLFLEATDPIHARELWVSDGTEVGTLRLTDGLDLERPGARLVPLLLHPTTGHLYFLRESGDKADLWVSDGTREGTRPLPTGSPSGSRTGYYRRFAALDRWFYFAVAGEAGLEIWRSDGRPAGTLRLHALPEKVSTSSFFPLADRILFFADDRVWTIAGDAMTSTATVGGQAVPRAIYAESLDRGLVFATEESDSPIFDEEGLRRLWITDGTEAGTSPLTELPGRTRGSARLDVATAVFEIDLPGSASEIWRSDGTAEGTAPVFRCSACFVEVLDRPVDGVLYLSLDEDGAGDGEPVLAYLDAAADGLRVVEGVPRPPRLGPRGVHRIPGAHRVAIALEAENGSGEWWSLAVSTGEAVRLTHLQEGQPHTPPLFPRIAGAGRTRPRALTWNREPSTSDGAFLFATATLGDGLELWRTDGTEEGTFPFDRLGDAGKRPRGSYPRELSQLGDDLVFFARDRDGLYGAWKSTGNLDTTRRFWKTSHWSHWVEGSVRLGDRVVYLVREGRKSALWSTDGTAAGTTLLGRRETTPVLRLAPTDGRVFTSLADGDLWVSDGTAEGTFVAGLPGLFPVSSWATDSESLNDVLYFAAPVDPKAPFRDVLWRTDGTSEGTRKVPVAGLDTGAVELAELRRAGELLFLVVKTERFEKQVWASDGTVAGTRRIAQAPLVTVAFPAGDRLVFATRPSPGVRDLWSSDGTAEGTGRIAEAIPGIPVTFYGLAEIGDGTAVVSYLGSPPEASGLLVTDGTAAGTRFLPLPAAISIPRLWAATGRVFYSFLRDYSRPQELWVLDPDLDGSTFLGYFGPQLNLDVTAAGDAVYFAAPSLEGESELWRIDLEPPSPRCVPRSASLCLQDGRFEVRARWRTAGGEAGLARAVPLPGNEESGLFWFFAEDNVELMVKVLDATSVNGSFWSFYGALTTVEYWIDVHDLSTGARHTFYNPPGEPCGGFVLDAFPESDDTGGAEPDRASTLGGEAPGGPPPFARGPSPVPAPLSPAVDCSPSPTRLCFLDGRFGVEVEWWDPSTDIFGTGHAVPLPGNEESGLFWFFGEDNLELVVKLIDGTPVNGRYWIFAGGLSTVAYTLVVTDHATGASRIYEHAAGEVCGEADTAAF